MLAATVRKAGTLGNGECWRVKNGRRKFKKLKSFWQGLAAREYLDTSWRWDYPCFFSCTSYVVRSTYFYPARPPPFLRPHSVVFCAVPTCSFAFTFTMLRRGPFEFPPKSILPVGDHLLADRVPPRPRQPPLYLRLRLHLSRYVVNRSRRIISGSSIHGCRIRGLCLSDSYASSLTSILARLLPSSPTSKEYVALDSTLLT